ncbi:MAG TPA: rhomboid family intramembrane serine protease [Ktedonobacteraceae bacterium]|nr:rhomboid family intramembrane serine protease [Ktedonobacteraceae bacterium]
MEAKTDAQTYIEQGKQALAQGQGREAAIAFAHAAQLEPDNPEIHLGLAESNLALGAYGVVYMACKKVQELQQEGGTAYVMSQALLDLLDRNYDRALQNLETVISEDPANAYAHAMRAYLLRIKGQDYDAGLARSRAARLSYGGTFANIFPPVEQERAPGYNGNGAAMPGVDVPPPGRGASQIEHEQIPNWNRSNMQRQVIRTRFWMSQNPRFVTNILIAINVLVYIVLLFFSATQGGGLQSLGGIDTTTLYNFGAQVGSAIPGHNDFWRIFSAMFLHFNLLHIGLNMLSLFFIGPAVEVFYGKWRYLTIYLLSGIVGGIVTYFFAAPNSIAAGASGAIFGVFGALGVFYFINRRALGTYGSGAITNWVFWLGLNLVFGFSVAGIGIADHIGGLVAGIVIAALLIPKSGRRRA